MTKLLKIFFFVFIINLARAEIIFHKEAGSSITPQEHQLIYNIMLENQFPTSIMYGSYVPNEVEAINKSINQKLPESNIIASFIPPTLYELFVLKFIKDNADNIENASNGVIEKSSGVVLVGEDPRNRASYVNTLISYKNWGREPKFFKELNLDSQVISFHLIINNFILDILNKNTLLAPRVVNDSIKIINSIDFWQQLRVSESGFYWVTKDRKNYLNPADMKKVVEIEYDAQNKNKFVLYRGSSDIDYQYVPSKLFKSEFGNRSISFGSTLLGGIFGDSGACAYCYMSDFSTSPVGYALLIDKKRYAEGDLSNMFYIPPLITLLDLLGKGEFFHSRSKVVDLTNIDSLSFQVPKDRLKPYTSIYQIDGPNLEKRQEIYRDMLNYIRDNNIVLKKPNTGSNILFKSLMSDLVFLSHRISK